jgi:hypothetical protein
MMERGRAILLGFLWGLMGLWTGYCLYAFGTDSGGLIGLEVMVWAVVVTPLLLLAVLTPKGKGR